MSDGDVFQALGEEATAHPNDPDRWLRMAEALLDHGSVAAAQHMLAKARSCAPRRADQWRALSALELRLGHRTSAEEALATADLFEEAGPFAPSVPEGGLEPSVLEAGFEPSVLGGGLEASVLDGGPFAPSVPDVRLEPSVPEGGLEASVPEGGLEPSVPEGGLEPSVLDGDPFAPWVPDGDPLAPSGLDRGPPTRTLPPPDGDATVETRAHLRTSTAAVNHQLSQDLIDEPATVRAPSSRRPSRAGSEPAGLQGSLALFPFPDMLQFLAQQQLSGVLRLRGAERTHGEVVLDKGRVVDVRHAQRPTLLTLLGRRHDLSKALRQLPPAALTDELELCRAFVELGILDAETLQAELRTRLELGIVALLSLTEGHAEFSPESLPPMACSPGEDARYLLLAALKYIDEHRLAEGGSLTPEA